MGEECADQLCEVCTTFWSYYSTVMGERLVLVHNEPFIRSN